MRMISCSILLLVATLLPAQPIALHPENPHYLVYKDRPTLLITSAEHYGAVLNTGFDYQKYLETLHGEGMNYTRIFVGSYVEIPGSFGIEKNTLSPAVGQFIAPWRRTGEPGRYEGEGKFDLGAWNPAYFERLRDFVREAADRDIIVEVTLFCSTYNDDYWLRHPFHPDNNINQLGELKRQESITLKNEKLVGYQKKMVEKIVTELNEFDNIFFEIQNEPWADNTQDALFLLKTTKPRLQNMQWTLWAHYGTPESMAWQREMAATIVATEQKLTKKHLIAQNYNNFKAPLPDIDPNISIINMHYVWPEAVWMNYGWDRPLNFDESGFAGSEDATYLEQAWAFMLAGGAVFNNLDYSFYPGAEDGTGVNNAPGGGSTILRRQLKILRDFLESFDFIRMRPDRQVVHHAPGLQWQALSEAKKQYAVFLSGQPAGWIELELPKGKYRYEWISPATGAVLSSGAIRSKGLPLRLETGPGAPMLALRIRRG